MDGYDKLTPYGMAIHGCIDGYAASKHSDNMHMHVQSNILPYILLHACICNFL